QQENNSGKIDNRLTKTTLKPLVGLKHIYVLGDHLKTEMAQRKANHAEERAHLQHPHLSGIAYTSIKQNCSKLVERAQILWAEHFQIPALAARVAIRQQIHRIGV